MGSWRESYLLNGQIILAKLLYNFTENNQFLLHINLKLSIYSLFDLLYRRFNCMKKKKKKKEKKNVQVLVWFRSDSKSDTKVLKLVYLVTPVVLEEEKGHNFSDFSQINDHLLRR
jgi:hypothetical protein